MKKLIIVVAVTALLAASCNEDDPAAPDPKPKPSPYSGTFDVDFTLKQTDCNFPPPLDALETITVNEDNFDWGGMVGTWDPDEDRGYGTSAQRCVPIPPPTGCVGCWVIEFDVTFASPDSFYGEITVPYEYSDECQATDCESVYDVTGVRAK